MVLSLRSNKPEGERRQMTIDMIPVGRENAISRNELCIMTGMTDRQMRKAIHELRRNHCILNVQDGNGYFRPTVQEAPLVRRFVLQERSRALSGLWASKGAKEWLKENADVHT